MKLPMDIMRFRISFRTNVLYIASEVCTLNILVLEYEKVTYWWIYIIHT